MGCEQLLSFDWCYTGRNGGIYSLRKLCGIFGVIGKYHGIIAILIENVNFPMIS